MNFLLGLPTFCVHTSTSFINHNIIGMLYMHNFKVSLNLQLAADFILVVSFCIFENKLIFGHPQYTTLEIIPVPEPQSALVQKVQNIIDWLPHETYQVFTEEQYYEINDSKSDFNFDYKYKNYNTYGSYEDDDTDSDLESDEKLTVNRHGQGHDHGAKFNSRKRRDDNALSSYLQTCKHTFDMWPEKIIRIISPFYGKNQSYPASIDCEWELIGVDRCIPQVECSTIDLRSTENCENEFLRVSDGLTSEKLFCGTDQAFSDPYTIRSGFYMYLTLKSGDSTYFDRIYKGIECTVMCHLGTRPRKEPVQLPPAVDFIKEENTCMCGRQGNDRNRIVGGTTAEKKEFPWQVALVKAGTRQPMCGASVINNQFILTAAHCLEKFVTTTSIEILLHAHVLDQTHAEDVKAADVELGQEGSIRSPGYQLDTPTDAQEKTLRLPIDKIMIHRLYDRFADFDCDIALLRLKSPLNLKERGEDDSITPVCLPKPEDQGVSLLGKMATVSGWGFAHETAGASTKILQKLQVPVLGKIVCDQLYGELGLSDNMMCAGYKEGGKDSCQGDSGGPLTLKETEAYVQIGIVSWGDGCGRVGKPGVYTKVANFIPWIRHRTRGAVWCRSS